VRTEDPAVRRRDSDVVYQITRDSEFERELHAQLDRFLSGTPRGSEAWLAFMMNGVPALRTLGWQITVDPKDRCACSPSRQPNLGGEVVALL
jgi:hypothetical protein